MAEERDDPVPTDDPRETETSDQNAEENPSGRVGRRASPVTAALARRPARRTSRRSRRRAGYRQPRRARTVARTHQATLCVRVGPTRSGGVAFPAMRKEAALIAVLGVLGWSASARVRGAELLAQWTLDEGAGQVAGDASGHGNTGELGASTGPGRRRPRLDPRPRRRQRAELRRHVLRDACPTPELLEPQQHRRRRMGPARRLARALALRAVQGLAASATAAPTASTRASAAAWPSTSPAQSQYTISPEVSAGSCGTARGTTSSAPTTATACGCGSTAARWARARPLSMAIAYTTGSKGIYIGTYRGSCDLGFKARSMTSPCGTTVRRRRRPGPVIAPVPDTPTQHRHRAAAGGSSPPGCDAQRSARAACA